MNAVVEPVQPGWLCCPHCGTPNLDPETYACAHCGTHFPQVDGIPWLFPDPARALSEWRTQSSALLAHLDVQAQRYRASLAPELTSTSTRNRLKLLASACDDQARRLRALLAPLDLGVQHAHASTYDALGRTRGTGPGLLAYFANVHRDWCWGAEENSAGLHAVQKALGGRAPGRMLVLGSGAGRLAYDLHHSLGPTETVAADIHPLLMFVARRMFAGERLPLYEFPVAPRDVASHAVLRTLAAPERANDGLRLVFADANQLPFAPGTFDTVVTPWLVDVVDADFVELVAAVNGVLAPGGRWVCTGTLFFERRDAAHCHATEEVAEIVAAGGFTTPAFATEHMPYLASPASRHARLEEVVTFVVTKWRPAAVAHCAAPRWSDDARTAVPLAPEVEAHALALRIEAYVASLVDGQRSIGDIAQRLVNERLLPAGEAVSLVRGFVARLHTDARR
jgi:SAM-dependent methyltransferase/uncharacterized protein YbaR (Trm112 family)